MTTIPALQKSIERLNAELGQAKASIRTLTDRIDNKPLATGLAGTASSPTAIHGSLAGLSIDDHLQYLHISNARTVSADHIYQKGTFNPTSTNPPFTIGINATNQFVNGLNADQVDGQEASDFYNITAEVANTVYSGPTSGGAADPSFRSLVDADLPTHDIISAHDVAGSIDQLVGLSATNTLGLLTPSDNPGAAKALLKTTSAGLLTLEDLNVTDDLNVGSGALIANGSSNIIGINKTPVGGYDLDINATLRTGGLATLASLSVTGAATFGDDLTVGANILFVDYSGERIGIKRAADPQFQLDILGNLRASGWIVGKHAIQLEGATAIFHFDGREPYESNYTGVSTGHKGQIPTTETAIIYRFGKFGKAIQSAEAITNLVINSSWENSLTSWTLGGSPPTDAVVTTESYYGDNSFHLITNADNQHRYQDITIVSSQIYNASVYVKVESGQVVLKILDGGGAPFYVESDVSWAGDDEWHRMHIRFTSTGTAGRVLVGRRDGYGSSGEYYIDAIQLEQYGSITPYCDGSLGPGHSFSGSDHASDSSRVGSELAYSGDLAKTSRGTIMLWVKFGGDGADSPDWEYIFQISASTGRLAALTGVGESTVRLYDGAGNQAGSTINDGGWHHVAVTWDGTDALLYLDGVLDITFTYSSFSGSVTSINIGTYPGAPSNLNNLNGWIDEVAFLNRVADADEIISVYESDAPVFAETSTFEWSTPSITTWVDEEGLWSRGAITGQEVFGISDVNSKSWAGLTLDEGDVVIGNSPSFLWWDDSNSRLALTGKLIATDGPLLGGTVFQEIWDDNSSINDWEVMSGTGELSIQSGGATGGSFLRVGDNSGIDGIWLQYKYNIPFDQNKSYKITLRVRRTNGTGVLYAGVLSIGDDGTTYHDTSGGNDYAPFHRIAANGAAPGSSWTIYEGYFRGVSGNGTVGPSNDPTNPGTLNSNATYFRPVVVVNWYTSGITEVDMEVVEMLPWGDDLTEIDGGRINALSIDTGSLSATAIDGMTITGATIIAGGGVVVLDDDGISVELSGYTPGGPRAYSFIDTADSVVGEISGVGSPGTGHSIDLYSSSLTGEDSDIGLWATSPNTNAATIILQANNVDNYNRITIGTTLTTFTDAISIASGGIQIGADTQILRDSANKIRIPDSLDIGGTLTIDTIDDSIAGAIAVNTDIDITGSLTVSASLGDTWTGVSFGSTWSDYGGAFQICEYKKHGDLVFLRGLALTASAWSTYPTICTLPSGYRPASTIMLATTGNGSTFTRIDILSTGVVQWIAGGSGSGWISLNIPPFSVD